MGNGLACVPKPPPTPDVHTTPGEAEPEFCPPQTYVFSECAGDPPTPLVKLIL